MSGQSETRNVRCRVHADIEHRIPARPIQSSHARDGSFVQTIWADTVLRRRRDEAGTKWLCQNQYVTRLCSRIRHDPFRMNRACDRNAEFDPRIANGVSADNCRSITRLGRTAEMGTARLSHALVWHQHHLPADGVYFFAARNAALAARSASRRSYLAIWRGLLLVVAHEVRPRVRLRGGHQCRCLRPKPNGPILFSADSF